MPYLPKLSKLFVAISLASSFQVAAEATDVSKISDEHITVTATRTARYFMESPVAISTVSKEDIKRSSSDSIADALRDVPGIQIDDAATPGMKRVSLRGESSLRVAILIDGQEITDHSTYGAPLLLDTSMVERVEVIRGTSSVLYGGKALGGVINIITKKGGEEPLQATLSASYPSATKGHQISGSLFGHLNGLDYRLSYANNEHEDRSTPAGDIDNSSFKNDSLSFYLAKEFDQHEIGVNIEQYNLSSEIATGMENFFLNMPQRDRTKYSVFYNYDFNSDFIKSLHFDVYKQTIDRNFVQRMEMSRPLAPPKSMDINVDTDIQEELATTGFNSQLDFDSFTNHHLILGFQYTNDDLNKQTYNKTETIMNNPEAPVAIPPQITEVNNLEDASLSTSAIYLQDEWRVNDELIVTTGIRHYLVDAKLNQSSRDGLNALDNDDSKMIASLAANYNLNEYSNVRAVFSQGYHYPTLLQIATGATAAGSFINPNQNLKPETSDNIELGYRLFTDNWLLDATYFYTQAENYITSKSCNAMGITCANQERDKVFVNANKADTSGLELSLKYQINENVTPYANLTFLSREEEYDGFKTSKTGTPSSYGKLGLKFEAESNLLGSYYVDGFLRTSSSADVAYADGSTEAYDSWKTINIALGNSFGDRDQYAINIELSNILDEEYSPANESLIAPGRAFMLKFSSDL